MKRKEIYRRGVSALLAAALVFSLSACGGPDSGREDSSPAASGAGAVPQSFTPAEAGEVKKTETVFVTLDAAGNPTQTIVTDWLHADRGGVQVRDKTDLSEVTNIKGNEQPGREGESLFWNLPGNDVYYRGETEKTLPVEVSIRYTLDGTEIEPSRLAGKAGRVGIEVSFRNTLKTTAEVNGEPVEMYTPMAVLAGVILPEDTFRNIETENAHVAGDGSNQIAVFLTVPGLEESLGLNESGRDKLDLSMPESFTITADTDRFELGNIAVAVSAGLPDQEESSLFGGIGDLDDISEMEGDFDLLKELQGELDGLSGTDSLRELLDSPTGAQDAQKLLDDLNEFYGMDTSLLDLLEKYVTSGNLETLKSLEEQLRDANLSDALSKEELKRLLNGMEDLDVDKAYDLLQEVHALESIDLSKITGMLGALNDAGALMDLMDASSALLTQLPAIQNSIQTLKPMLDAAGNASGVMDDLGSLKELMDASGIHLDEATVKAMLTAAMGGMDPAYAQILALPAGAVTSGNPVEAQYQAAVCACIDLAAEAGSIDEPARAALTGLVTSGNPVTDPYAAQLTALVQGVQANIGSQMAGAQQQLNQAAASVMRVLSEVQGLESSMAGIDQAKMAEALQTVNAAMPQLESLASQLAASQGSLEQVKKLLGDKETLNYLKQSAAKLTEMKATLDANDKNLTLVRDLLAAADDPDLRRLASGLPELRQTLDRAEPILKGLSEDIDKGGYRAALDQSPETIDTLKKIAGDLNRNRKIADALEAAVTPANFDLASSMLKKLDSLNTADSLNQIQDIIDDGDILVARKDAYVALGEEYRIFTACEDGMKSSVRFVMKTDEIR